MRLLMAGGGALAPRLAAAFAALGHRVDFAEACAPEGVASDRPFDLGAIWRGIDPAPDALLVLDTLDRRALPFGLEAVTAPRLYWAIDLHLNWFWQRHFVQGFDLVLAAQRDFVSLCEDEGVRAHWLPWAADAEPVAVDDTSRTVPLVFVGTVDAARPKRAALLARLAERYPLQVFGTRPEERLGPDAMARAFCSAHIVVNESVLGEVNFRTFEAMACGAMLLTEDVGNGLRQLFTPGLHLDVFTPHTLYAQVERYLADGDARRRIAAAGFSEVQARHTMVRRAETMIGLLAAGVERRTPGQRAAGSFGRAAHLLAVRGLAQPGPTLVAAAQDLAQAAAGSATCEAPLVLAEIAIVLGNSAAAAGVLAEACRRDPGDLRVWLLAAEAARRLGSGEAAARILREGIAVARDLAPETRRRAAAALTADPDGADAWHALGLALLDQGLPAWPGFIDGLGTGLCRTALDHFRTALARDRAHAPAAGAAAGVLALIGLAEHAADLYAVVADGRPGDPLVAETHASLLRAAYRFDEAAG